MLDGKDKEREKEMWPSDQNDSPADAEESLTQESPSVTAEVEAGETDLVVQETSIEDPVLELPEIPAAGPMGVEPDSRQANPGESRQRRSGWKVFVASVALVAVGAAVGSATTMAFGSHFRTPMPPIGFEWDNSLAKPVVQLPQEGHSVVPDIYRRVAPSVVSIRVAGPQSGQGNGSGLVVDSRGYILTNHHVIDGASRIEVKFVDGTTLEGQVIGRDPYKDLAILKVDPGNRSLVAATLGDSNEILVGELAIAIGSPFGQDNSVTAGIISSLDRDLRGEKNPFVIPGVIQTDAAINPGNSGGPLLNARGEVIGINTAIEGPVRGNVGIGFAVPINAAKEILPNLIAGERIEYPYLGIALGDLTSSIAQQLGLSVSQGALVTEVHPDTPAAKAGLASMVVSRNGNVSSADVIVQINETPMQNADDLVRYIQTRRVGEEITLTVLRGGERLTLKTTLIARPELLPQN
jgi:S1-C subfamily serine protease